MMSWSWARQRSTPTPYRKEPHWDGSCERSQSAQQNNVIGEVDANKSNV